MKFEQDDGHFEYSFGGIQNISINSTLLNLIVGSPSNRTESFYEEVYDFTILNQKNDNYNLSLDLNGQYGGHQSIFSKTFLLNGIHLAFRLGYFNTIIASSKWPLSNFDYKIGDLSWMIPNAKKLGFADDPFKGKCTADSIVKLDVRNFYKRSHLFFFSMLLIQEKLTEELISTCPLTA